MKNGRDKLATKSEKKKYKECKRWRQLLNILKFVVSIILKKYFNCIL